MRLAASLFVLGAVLTPASAAEPAANDSLPLVELVRQVKVALLHVADAAESQRLPKLESATLEVNTSIRAEGSGKVSLWVVEAGANAGNDYASTVTLTLKPPPPGSASDIAAVRLSDALRDAILAGARAIAAAGEGKPPLVASELVAKVRFAVERDASGGLAIKFPPFEASAGGKIASTAVQAITVTYQQ